MLGFEFDNNSEPYSVFNLAQATGVVIFQLIETTLTTRKSYTLYLAVVGIIGICSCGITFFFDYRDKKSLSPMNKSDTSPSKTNENKA